MSTSQLVVARLEEVEPTCLVLSRGGFLESVKAGARRRGGEGGGYDVPLWGEPRGGTSNIPELELAEVVLYDT